MFARMKVSTKLLGSFAITLVLMAGLAVYSLVQMSRVNDSTVELTTIRMPAVRTVLAIKADVNRFRTFEFRLLLADNPTEVATVIKGLDEKMADIKKGQNEYAKLLSSPEDQQNYESYQRAFEAYVTEHQQLRALVLQNKVQEAKVRIIGESLKHYNELRADSDKISEVNIHASKKAGETAAATYGAARF